MGKKRTKVFRWTSTKSIVVEVTLTGGTVTLLQELWQLDNNVTIRPKLVVGSFGISDDPTDESLTWVLSEVDPDQLPTGITPLVGNSVWAHNDTWRSIGTDSGPVDVTTERSDELDSVHSAGEVQDNLAFCCLIRSNTTSATRTHAIVTADIEYRQDRYNNDEFNDTSEEQHAIHS